MNVRRYLGETVQEMVQHGWAVKFENRPFVYSEEPHVDRNKCHGFAFSDPNYPDDYSLTVAVGSDVSEWLSLYAHEVAHFRQWQERSPRQRRDAQARYDRAERCLDKWERKLRAYSNRQLWAFARALLCEEGDAECRALADIARRNLPVDVKEYKRKANAYMLSIAYRVVERKHPSPMITTVDEIVNVVDNGLDLFKNTSRVREVYLQEYRELFLEFLD